MNKKAIYSILSTIVAMVVLSVSLVLAIGPRVSAYINQNRILVLDDWDDFAFRSYGYNMNGTNYGYEHCDDNDDVVCYRFSDKVVYDVLGFVEYYQNCGYGGADLYKLSDYDEIHVIFPDGVKAIDTWMFKDPAGVLGPKVTYVYIPQSVEVVDRNFASCLDNATIYCECSEEYANEHWMEDWDSCWNYKTQTYEKCSQRGQVVWNYTGTEPEPPVEENDEINNQNNNALIWGIAGTAAGILIIAGIVVGIVISKRRRK